MPKGRISSAILIVLLSIVGVANAGSPRLWTSRDGIYKTEAEGVELRGGAVVLRRADGSTLEVALDKLSDADAQFARTTLPVAPAVAWPRETTAALQASPATIEKLASSYRTAREALLIYRTYYSAFPPDAELKFSVDNSLSKWQHAANEKQLRIGRTWFTPEKYSTARRTAQDLLVQAAQHLQSQSGDAARESLAEAARTDLDSPIAPGITGLAYAVNLRNYEQAKLQFTEAVRRDPNDATALNNLALAEFRNGNSTAAVAKWLQAVEIAPTSREIVHNVLHLLDEIDKKSVPEPSFGMNGLRVMQRQLRESGAGAEAGRGWLYLPPCGPLADVAGLPQRATIMIGQRGGIVVGPQHVLTCVDVLDSPHELFVSQPELGPRQESQHAEVIAHEPGSGLLLLKVAQLSAPALSMSEQFPRVGTNISLAGMVKPTHFTEWRSAQRGLLVSAPSVESGEWFLCASNSGPGPGAAAIADAFGRVFGIAVMSQKLGQTASFAVSNQFVSTFLTKHLPDYRPAKDSETQQTWEQIDAKLLKSLVLVETRRSLRSELCAGIQKPTEQNSFGSTVSNETALEDVYCNRCRGFAAVNCPVPSCANGGVLVEVSTVVGRVDGKDVVRIDKVRRRCDRCSGQGKVSCPVCTNGRAAGL